MGRLRCRASAWRPGDSLVYRLVAQDGRTGDAGGSRRTPTSSRSPALARCALEGVEMPPDTERYALSQQMIVLKIRRLASANAGSPPHLEEQTGAIAAEQRIGAGELHLPDGRHTSRTKKRRRSSRTRSRKAGLENSQARHLARRSAHDQRRAGACRSQHGGRAPAGDAGRRSLQRAFGRNRYILRTLASRTSVDPSRRLTGARDDVERGVRTVAPPAGTLMRDVLAGLLVRVLDLVAQARHRVEPHPRGCPRSPRQALGVKPDDRTRQETSRAVLRLREVFSVRDTAAREAFARS